MEVLILYAPNCPSRKILSGLIKQVLDEFGITYEITEEIIRNNEEAVELRFYGSPTIKVNGVDLEPGADEAKEPGLG